MMPPSANQAIHVLVFLDIVAHATRRIFYVPRSAWVVKFDQHLNMDCEHITIAHVEHEKKKIKNKLDNIFQIISVWYRKFD